jgi:prefoldin subunit 5
MGSVLTRLQKKLSELESLKERAITELLEQRAEIDRQLRELGYKRGRKPGRGRPKGSKNRPKSS